MRAIRSAAVVAATILLASGCSGLPGAPEPESGTSAPPVGKPLKSTVAEKVLDAHPETSEVKLRLQRLGEDHLVASVTIANTGEEDIELDYSPPFAEDGTYVGEPNQPYFGIGVLDLDRRTLDLPYRDAEDGVCVCTKRPNTENGLGLYHWYLEPGQSRTYAAAMPAPKGDVRHLDIYTAMSGLFLDVPISGGTPDLKKLGLADPDDALKAGAKPHPWTLSARTTSEDDDIVEDSAGTNINLDADVLFDTNKAELNGAADTVLAEVAAEVEDYGATELEISGHTDSTGNDAINKPLSKKRASAVRDALAELIGSGPELTATGYGSSKPIASNDDAEGRQRNRRVTVTVPQDAKTATAKSPSAAPSAAGTPAAEVSVKAKGEYPAEVRLTELRRVSDEVVALSYTVENLGDDEIGDFWPLGAFNDPWAYMLTPPSGFALRDPATKRSYTSAGFLPKGKTGQLACACTDVDLYLEPGETSGVFTNLMIVPEHVPTVDVTTETFTVEDVRIG